IRDRKKQEATEEPKKTPATGESPRRQSAGKMDEFPFDSGLDDLDIPTFLRKQMD
ncbi:MAG: hypothetical protein GWN62_21830, partial [Aliifodinibius sp.]|nr:hypothetical protein [Fodinibius sp.]